MVVALVAQGEPLPHWSCCPGQQFPRELQRPGARMLGVAEDAGGGKEWRRVSSTHDLQDLLQDPRCAKPPWKYDGVLLARGLALIAAGATFGVATTFAIISSWLPMQHGGDGWLSAIAADRYYCLLMPLTCPMLVIAVSARSRSPSDGRWWWYGTTTNAIPR